MATASEIPMNLTCKDQDHPDGSNILRKSCSQEAAAKDYKQTEYQHSPEDLSILDKPYAKAVESMGINRPDLIIYAVKLLNLRKRSVQGTTVLIEVDRLLEYERKGLDLPPLEPPPPPPPPHSDSESDYDSDSDSDCDSMEYFSSHDPHEPEEIAIRNIVHTDDLQTDSCPLNPVEKIKLGQIVKPLEDLNMADAHLGPSAKNTKKSDSILDQKQRLHVLRMENKRLKQRQLCRNCRSKTVSITFLPCGHYAYCYECGQSYSSCPICCKTILADVKTFLA